MRRALITGPTSLVGRHLAETLISKDIVTRVLVRHGESDYIQMKRKGMEVQSGDIRDVKVADRAIKGVDVVFNCIGSMSEWMPYTEWRSHVVEGSRNIFTAAAKENVKRVVHLSSADVFGYEPKNEITETSPYIFWNDPYPDAKISLDRLAWSYSKEQRLPLTAIYPSKVYGENDFGFIGSLTLMIRNSTMRFWRGDNEFFPLYVGNLVAFMLAVAEMEDAAGEGYLIHDGRPKSLKFFCDHIARSIGVPPITQKISYLRGILSAQAYENLAKLNRKERRPIVTPYVIKSFKSAAEVSLKKLRVQLGWSPEYTTHDGLNRTSEWLSSVDTTDLIHFRKPIRF